MDYFEFIQFGQILIKPEWVGSNLHILGKIVNIFFFDPTVLCNDGGKEKL